MARQRRGRDINGILLLDKPPGVTSNGALQVVKRLFSAAKAGHTGSLDPLATGMLPICFGEATKFSQFLLDADKSYRVTARLGVTTETGDADGAEVTTRPVTSDAATIEQTLMTFLGDIQQIPSMYSAIKHQGQPLYKLARQGIEVERKPRNVTIKRLAMLAVDGDDVTFEVDCTKGTYVRSLVEDLGTALGCGGHVTMLRRLSAGPYPTSEMLTMDELGALKEEGGFEAIDARLLPVATSVADWPRVQLGPDAAHFLCQGQPVMAAERPRDGQVALYRADSGAFLGVGEVQEDGMIAPRRLVAQPQ
ncbi:tRNA pseudouridine(55) synthase TruB [Alcanivorax sp. JB21]|uniref:tRNA pseudouridine(55) synthase TruB n=1 Tax=Alcanivorax limicola TaxID=2874102 RepID=UPI001CBED3D5|nr:tRNA pseudouridine(55) synthase TruB [Alcanivorax limicola]MBZ2189394.1 tRNA pseudouridine(55) synthase TruB [Alcanivorax limicola]